ncbi:carbohydrate ABC transporter permease [Pseudactinotalea sp. Z1748]|uniref:carbohydrate ABC transporter permease n=1 Tax=Pseudactinotalea sp. Z1748 TaxID=3413027 RepID=UPI003C7CBDD7
MTLLTASRAQRRTAGGPTGGGRRRTLAQRQARWAWVFALPATAHIAIWTGLPILVAGTLSLTHYDILNPPTWAGVANYVTLWNDAMFWRALWHNLVIAIVGIPISMLIALVLAVMLNQGLRGSAVYRTAVFLPHVTATVAIAMIWLWIYSPGDNGLLNRVGALLGIPNQQFLISPDQALGSIILVTIWQGLGLKMMIYLAYLQGIDQQLYEAAEIDGATSTQKFFRITMPMVKPATFFILVTSIVGNFQTFDLIFVLTQGGPANATTVITWEIYETAFQQFRMGLASAQSMVLLAVLVVLTVLSRKLTGGHDD